jgi:hypothetical protein
MANLELFFWPVDAALYRAVHGGFHRLPADEMDCCVDLLEGTGRAWPAL